MTAHLSEMPAGSRRAAMLELLSSRETWRCTRVKLLIQAGASAQGMLADVSIATGWATIALMLTGRFVFQVFPTFSCFLTAAHLHLCCCAILIELWIGQSLETALWLPHLTTIIRSVLAVLQHLGWGVAATVTPVVMLLAGGTFFGTSILSRVGTGAAAGLAAAGATAGAVTQVWRPSSAAAVVIRMLSGFYVLVWALK